MKSYPPNLIAGRSCISRRGFALVVTLTLMVLLSILALGMLSLSSISLRHTNSETANRIAHANARMALTIAVGELQRQLGPDQRINTNASQITGAAEGRGSWVGVYDSWDSTVEKVRPDPVFRKWLVSGDQGAMENSDTVKSTGAQDLVFWQGEKPDGSDKISIPKVELKAAGGSSADGAYAWWVGDENSKALVKKLPEDHDRTAAVWSNSQSAPASGYHLSPELAGLDRSSPDLDKIASAGTMDLVVGARGTSGKVSQDFTTSSAGVLADVAHGGLKRDISLFLDHPVSKTVAVKLPNTDRIYDKGITWEELWLFHNVWRELEPPAPGLASMTGGSLTNTHILMTKPGTGAQSISAFRNDPFSIYKLPNFIRSQWLLSLWAEAKPGATPTAPPKYELSWVTDGILTLWNPFDVPIALHPDSYMSYKYWNIPYTIRLSDGSGKIIEKTFIQITRTGGHSFTMVMGTAPDPYWSLFGSPDPVVLMPGEVLVMSEGPGAGTPRKFSDGGGGLISLAMKAGWNLGRGFGFPVDLDSGKTVTASSKLRFDAFPNKDRSWFGGTTIINQHYYYGADNRGSNPGVSRFETVGGRIVNLGSGSDSFATAHGDVFKSFSGSLPAVPALTGAGKYPFLMLSHQVKSEDDPSSWSRLHNERYMKAHLRKMDDSEKASSGHELVVKQLSGNQDSNMPQLSTRQINRGLFGPSYTDQSRGQDTVITLSVPREPPVSLGAFQHAIANGVTARWGNGGEALSNDNGLSAPETSHAISNSYAFPVIEADKTENSEFTDHSYHVNRMLWDSWFLSTIVQRQSPHHSQKRTAKQVYEDFLIDPQKPLPNTRFTAWPENGESTSDKLFATTDSAKPDAYEKASSALLCEGAFNVNSTSKEAWKAMLSSLQESSIPLADGTDQPGSAKASVAKDVPMGGLLTAYGDGVGAGSAAFAGPEAADASLPAPWRGYRSLEATEIDLLATEIVAQVKARGPFLSMADFINRRPSGGTDMALRGPLQAALDKTVNTELFSTSSRMANPGGAGFAFPEAAILPKSMNTPGMVRQADILTAIGAQLTARSDTFRIRAYGEARDQAGNITATAWCEAMVQRTPGYLDPSDPAEAVLDTSGRSVPKVVSPVNKDMGRKMVVSGFRWLNPGDLKS